MNISSLKEKEDQDYYMELKKAEIEYEKKKSQLQVYFGKYIFLDMKKIEKVVDIFLKR